MTSAAVGQARTHCSHWMQSPKRRTRLLLSCSSRTSVGQTVTQASQPVQRSSLMLWMRSFVRGASEMPPTFRAGVLGWMTRLPPLILPLTQTMSALATMKPSTT